MVGPDPTATQGYLSCGQLGLVGIPSKGWRYWNETNWQEDTQLEVKEFMLI